MFIYFDFDGTLIDVREKYFALYSEFMSGRKGVLLSKEQFWSLKRMKGGDSLILQQSGLDRESPQLFRAFIREHVETSDFLDKDVLFPGVEDFLKEISRHHTCRIITSRRNRERFIAQIESLGIGAYFDGFVVAPKLDLSNPQYTHKATVLKNYVDCPERFIIVGDTEDDILTGRQLNIQSFAVTSGIRERAFLEKLMPDHILNSVTELTAFLALD